MSFPKSKQDTAQHFPCSGHGKMSGKCAMREETETTGESWLVKTVKKEGSGTVEQVLWVTMSYEHAVWLLRATDQAQALYVPGKYSTTELHPSTTILFLKKSNYIYLGRGKPWHT